MISRSINLLKILNSNESFFLFGSRGTGKSFLIDDILKGYDNKLVINLLDVSQYTRYMLNPSLVKSEIETKLKGMKSKLIVFIDEIQKLPIILNDIHLLIETYKNKLQFILTGSSARKLKAEGANLLAGRAILFKLFPFQAFELKEEFDLYKALRFGTLPMTYNKSDEICDLILRTYVETYLREEIKQEALTRNIQTFSKFLDLAAQYNSEIVNYSDIGKDCHVSPNTIITYYQILFDTMIAFEIPAWERSIKKQLIKSPKIYFFDCGVLNAIRKELGIEISNTSRHAGKLFETFIINEIVRKNQYLKKDYTFYHWRTKSDQEVDLILEKSKFKAPIAIEIKMKEEIFEDDIKSLLLFKEEEKKAELYCFCNTPRAYDLKGVKIINWVEGLKVI